MLARLFLIAFVLICPCFSQGPVLGESPKGEPSRNSTETKLPAGAILRYGVPPLRLTGLAATFFSPDGSLLAATSNYGDLALWQTSDGKLIHRIRCANPGPGAFSRDGQRVIAGRDGKAVGIWSTKTGALLKTLDGIDGLCVAVCAAETDRQVAVRTLQGTIYVWDIKADKKLFEVKGMGGHLRSLALSPDGKLLVAGERGSVRIYSTDDKKLVRLIESPGGKKEDIVSVAFSDDGKVLFGGSDTSLYYWQVGTWELCHKFRTSVRAIATAGDRVASGERLPDNDSFSVIIRTVNTAAAVKRLGLDLDASGTVSLSKNGRLLAAADERGQIWLWNFETERFASSPSGHAVPVKDLVFLPKDKFLATAGSDNTIRIWDASTGRLSSQLKLPKSDASGAQHDVLFESLCAGSSEHYLFSLGARSLLFWSITNGSICRRTALRQEELGEWDRDQKRWEKATDATRFEEVDRSGIPFGFGGAGLATDLTGHLVAIGRGDSITSGTLQRARFPVHLRRAIRMSRQLAVALFSRRARRD